MWKFIQILWTLAGSMVMTISLRSEDYGSSSVSGWEFLTAHQTFASRRILSSPPCPWSWALHFTFEWNWWCWNVHLVALGHFLCFCSMFDMFCWQNCDFWRMTIVDMAIWKNICFFRRNFEFSKIRQFSWMLSHIWTLRSIFSGVLT